MKGVAMGSICGIHRNPQRWYSKELGKLADDGRTVLEVAIGWYDDYLPSEYCVYMLEEHYKKILDGKFKFAADARSYICLELYDESGVKIEPILRGNAVIY
jgi:hypothetical protein